MQLGARCAAGAVRGKEASDEHHVSPAFSLFLATCAHACAYSVPVL